MRSNSANTEERTVSGRSLYRGMQVPCPEKKFSVWQIVAKIPPSLPQLFFLDRFCVQERGGSMKDRVGRLSKLP